MEIGYFDNNRCPAAKDSHVLSIHSQHVNMVQRIPRQQNLFNFGLVKLETCQLCCDFITSLPTCGELAMFGFLQNELLWDGDFFYRPNRGSKNGHPMGEFLPPISLWKHPNKSAQHWIY